MNSGENVVSRQSISISLTNMTSALGSERWVVSAVKTVAATYPVSSPSISAYRQRKDCLVRTLRNLYVNQLAGSYRRRKMRLRRSNKGVPVDFVWPLPAQMEKALCAERTRDWTEKFGCLGIKCTRSHSSDILTTLISRRLRVDW